MRLTRGINKAGFPRKPAVYLFSGRQTTPCASMAVATFRKPAMFAPAT